MKASQSTLLSALVLAGLAMPTHSQVGQGGQDPRSPGAPFGSRSQEELVRPPAGPDLSDKALLRLRHAAPEAIENQRLEDPSRAAGERRGLRDRDAQGGPGAWRIGVRCVPVDPILRDYLPIPGDSGLVVERVVPESPADRAGLRERDILVAVAGGPPIPLPDLEQLRRLVQTAGREGKPLRLIRLREGQKTVVTVQPEKPEPAEPVRRRDRVEVPLEAQLRELLEPLSREMRKLDEETRQGDRSMRDRLERESNGIDRRFKELRQQQRQQFHELNQRIDAQNQAIERMAKQLRRLSAERDQPREAPADHGDHE